MTKQKFLNGKLKINFPGLTAVMPSFGLAFSLAASGRIAELTPNGKNRKEA